jgi:hypothetical protein
MRRDAFLIALGGDAVGPGAADPVDSDALLRVAQTDRAGAHVVFEAVLQHVFRPRPVGAGVRLGPQVGDVGGAAAELEWDEMVELEQ